MKKGVCLCIENELESISTLFDDVRIVKPLSSDKSNTRWLRCRNFANDKFKDKVEAYMMKCSEKAAYSKGKEVSIEVIDDHVYIFVSKFLYKEPDVTVLEMYKSLNQIDEIIQHVGFSSHEVSNYLHEFNYKRYLDELTGAFNRRYLNDNFNQFQERANHHKYEIGYALIDIDNFKMINDSFGQHIGDEVLKEVTNLFISNIRKSTDDYMIRLGGDEFMIAMNNINKKDFIKRLEEFKRSVSNLPLLKNLGANTSISIGFIMKSEINSENITVEEMLSVIDSNLYKAKSKGKNCIYTEEKASKIAKSIENTNFRGGVEIVVAM